MFCCMGGWYSLSSSCSAFRPFPRLCRFLGVLGKPRLPYFSLSLTLTQLYDTVARIPFSRANRFFLFRVAWVKSKSYNLWRLCVVVARFPSQVAPAQTPSYFWWAVVHGSSTALVSPRPCAVHSSLVRFAHSSLISKDLLAAHEISLARHFRLWSHGEVAVDFHAERLSQPACGCRVDLPIHLPIVIFLCSSCSQFQADSFVSLLLGLRVGSLGPPTLSSPVNSTSAAVASSFSPEILCSHHSFIKVLESDGRFWLCQLRGQHSSAHCSPHQDWLSSVSR